MQVHPLMSSQVTAGPSAPDPPEYPPLAFLYCPRGGATSGLQRRPEEQPAPPRNSPLFPPLSAGVRRCGGRVNNTLISCSMNNRIITHE